jgi:hypothetical protein
VRARLAPGLACMEALVDRSRRNWTAGIALLALAAILPACAGSRLCRHGDCPPPIDRRDFEYPRFHPVPTRPVFSPPGMIEEPSIQEPPPSVPRQNPAGRAVPPRILPEPPNPFEEIPPPSGVQPNGLVPAPPAPQPPGGGNDPAASAHPGGAQAKDAWVFRPSLPESALKGMDPTVEVKATLPAKGGKP